MDIIAKLNNKYQIQPEITASYFTQTYCELVSQVEIGRSAEKSVDIGSLAAFNADIKAKHRGKREIQPICIETYMAEGLNQYSTENCNEFQDENISQNNHCKPSDEKKNNQPDESNNEKSGNWETVIRNKERKQVARAQSACESKRRLDLIHHEQMLKKDNKDNQLPHSSQLTIASAHHCSLDELNSNETCSSSSGAGVATLYPKARSTVPSVQPSVLFFSGNPLVEKTEGIIHMYKDSKQTSTLEGVVRSEMLCMLSVPATMNTQDLLHFVAPSQPSVEHIRIVRNGMPNQYMVLLKFRSQEAADIFYKTYNNERYNSLEPEICHIVYVMKVEVMKESEGGYLPVPGMTELPVCPVCLERMDESVEGILTVLCNHSFHGSCIVQWGDTSCPICRFAQTPEVLPDNKCSICGCQENLWMCLICGHIGCGRYNAGHAHQHYIDTSHTFSLQLGNEGNNRVWDYAGDNYVHRLVQNKGDGKLVEVDEQADDVQDEKLDSIQMEYTFLLTNQLESQRRYFQTLLEQKDNEIIKRLSDEEILHKKLADSCAVLEQKMAELNKEKLTAERKCTQLSDQLKKALHDLGEERQMNSCLRHNQTDWQSKVTKLEAEIACKEKEIHDLNEQLKDIMFHLESQQAVAQADPSTAQEIQEGQIVMQSSAANTSHRKGRKKGH